jgi:electron transfer flavoprotein beta subunit
MDIVVFTKRVLAAQEEELRILSDGKLDLSRLPFKVNDWDNYAVEAAVRIVEDIGGVVTAISMGDKESDDVLRRAIAMGAKGGFLLEQSEAPYDPYARAVVMSNFIKKEGLTFDAVFTGVQSEDDQFGAVGGMLAALLKMPYSSMVIGIDQVDGSGAIIRRELEGGIQERIKMKLPCVLSIQSGINEPRYVSIMGIRKASAVERKVFAADAYGDGVTPLIDMVRWLYPPKSGGATMLTGEIESVCKDLLGILKDKGVWQ